MRTSSVAQYALRMTFGQASTQSASSVFTTASPDRVVPRSATMMAVFGIAISSFSLKQMLASSGANKSSEAALTLRKL
ncbi:uncharacterized protein LOC101449070 isoform X2 [Ceratitis capitata]|uniref:(Mediterranean fruit fly) hypothetical protein n=1 Tax=Ceratitis capitata TaxID=7213 RepID=A0A811VKA0_CERCA|nr:uncharacterized protein LOC101449070 isoform X2 [Ceratitis capitata]XP_012161382.1 uncharacterized protein LOC101449070 isoform X2 [Ceratitis capitata]CAD7014543.1 unnamed protein product [Ceratitis capitata]